MSRGREHIHDLQRKINFLMQMVMGEENLLRFSKEIGVPRKTLDDGISAGGLSSGIQSALAKKCNFGLDWPEWSDPFAARQAPDGERRDTFEAFEKRYRAGLKDANQHRLTGQLLEFVRISQPWTVRDELATLEIFPGQAGPDEPWQFTFELVCRWTELENRIVVGIKRGLVELDLGEAVTSDVSSRVRSICDDKNGSNRITLTPGGPTQRPYWIVESSDGPIGVVSLSHGLCPVSGLADGDIVRATFSVWFKDLSLKPDQDDEEDDAIPEDDFEPEDSRSFVRQGYKTLGKAKQRILTILEALELSGGQSERVVIAVHEGIQFRLRAENEE